MEDTMVDIFDSSSQNNQTVNNNSVDIIPIDQIFNNVSSNVDTVTNQNITNNIPSDNSITNQEQTVTSPEMVVKKKDKVLRVQIALIVVWVVLTALVYFFGYDLFEPFIKVD